jgi:hypothetical protein
MKKFSIIIISALAIACVLFAGTPDGDIDETAARKLAIQQYHKLFLDKYFFNPVDKEHYKFPELDAKFFHKAEVKDGCWWFVGDPPAGVYVYAKVDLKGRWVQLTRVGFAPE